MLKHWSIEIFSKLVGLSSHLAGPPGARVLERMTPSRIGSSRAIRDESKIPMDSPESSCGYEVPETDHKSAAIWPISAV